MGLMYSEAKTATDTGIDAVGVGTTTGNVFDVSKRQIVGFQITAASITSGNGVFSVDGSMDGTNFVTGIAMQDATATASTTYVTSKTQSSNGSSMLYLPSNPWRYLRPKVVGTTDGSYTVTAEFKG